MMASFRDSVEALKETGLSSSEIIETVCDRAGSQLNGSISIPKTNLNNPSNKNGRALLQENSNSNVETPTFRKRKAGAFSSEKYVWIQKREGI